MGDIAELCSGVGNLQSLEHLELRFGASRALQPGGVAELGRAVGKVRGGDLQALRHFVLDFRECDALDDNLRKKFEDNTDFLTAVGVMGPVFSQLFPGLFKTIGFAYTQ